MRFLILWFLFTTGSLYSQDVYTSYFTETYPSIFKSRIEKTFRTITFEPGTVTITTNVNGGKQIEVLAVQKLDFSANSLKIYCTTRGGLEVVLVLPQKKIIEFIDYYSRHPTTGEEFQVRFFVEQKD